MSEENRKKIRGRNGQAKYNTPHEDEEKIKNKARSLNIASNIIKVVESKKIAVIIDGVKYESIRSASNNLGIQEGFIRRSIRKLEKSGLSELELSTKKEVFFKFEKVKDLGIREKE